MLHSYDLTSGQLNWKESILQENNTLDDSPYFEVHEHKTINSSSQLLTLVRYSEDININQLTLTFDEDEKLDEIYSTDNSFECVDYCSDDIIFSAEEVIGVSHVTDGEDRITSLSSSRGTELDITLPRLNCSLDQFLTVRNYINGIKMTATDMFLSGWIGSPFAGDDRSYIGYLISDNGLTFRMFNLNDSGVYKMIALSDNLVLAQMYKSRGSILVWEMVIWSFSRINTLDFITPLWINIAPAIFLVLITASLGIKLKKESNVIN